MADENKTTKNNESSEPGPSANPLPKEDGSSGAILPEAAQITAINDNNLVVMVT